MTGMRMEGKSEAIQEYRTAVESAAAAYCSNGGSRSARIRQRRAKRLSVTGMQQGTLDFGIEKFVRSRNPSERSTAGHEPEQHYRAIVETMIDGAITATADGTILYSNRGFSRMVGIPAETLAGLSFSRFVGQEYQDRYHDMLEKSRDGREQAEIGLVAADGRKLSAYLSGSGQMMNGENRVCMVVTDITKRVTAENALKYAKDGLEQAVQTLQESQARYLDLYENANDVIFTLDLQGNFTSANRNTYRELGFGPEAMIGKNFLEIFTPESAQFASMLIQKALAQKLQLLEEQPWEFEAITRNGSVITLEVRARFISESDSVVGVQCIARNITERKQVEMELNRLATAIEQAAESVIILDKHGKIQYANNAFFRTSGYVKDEVMGKSPAFLKSNKKDDETFYSGLLSTLSTKAVWTGRVANRRKDGSTYEAETTISPVRDKTGKVMNFVAVERDVTEEVRLESHLRQMQKMEAIGTLAGGIAHDFNNILSAIIGFSEMSIEDIPEGHPAKHYASQILKAATRGRDLVRQILMFSHKNEGERKHFKLSLIVNEALKLIRASLPSTIEIRQSISAQSDVVFASPTQMHQILMNLCTNAGHAMRIKGGVLEVSLTEFDIETLVDAPYLGMEPGRYLKISVSDTGVGMDRTTMERIFDPFFTTKAPNEGTGMGLAVVHGIVKSHGGAITVKSVQGRGSVFDVYFPRVDVTDSSEAEPVSDSQKGSERVLLIDDEEVIIEMQQSLLKRLGYQVVVASDSLEALDVFRKGPDRFDIVITDHTMPHMTGAELARELLQTRNDIPIILCTGYSEMVNREMAKEIGIREFVMKPVSRNELAAIIRRVLDDKEES